MAALNTIIAGGAINQSNGNYGATPAGTILQKGDKLTVTTVAGSILQVWNVGKVSRPVNAADTPTTIASGSTEEFGPYVGVRHFWWGFTAGQQASYSISRDE